GLLRTSSVGPAASFKPRDSLLMRAIFALKKVVPTLPATRGTLAPSCTRGVRPSDPSKAGTTVSLAPLPCHCAIDTPSHTVPGAIKLASSIHANGAVAVGAPPATAAGRLVLVGGGAAG